MIKLKVSLPPFLWSVRKQCMIQDATTPAIAEVVIGSNAVVADLYPT